MVRIHPDEATRDELLSLRREAWPPKVRDLVEMPTLADAGWSAPGIAVHLSHCGQTARDLLKNFTARGVRAIHPRRAGLAPDAIRPDRAAAFLARVRSTISSRPNSDNAAKNPNTSLPLALLVSIVAPCPVSTLKPIPRDVSSCTVLTRCRRSRPRRSSLHTTTVSFSRNAFRHVARPGRPQIRLERIGTPGS